MMMAVHELGHVVAAWVTGGTVTEVVLHPLAISRTEVRPNPHPLVVAWAGPWTGVLLPTAGWGIWHLLALPGQYLLRWFVGFCLIANGAYLGLGSVWAIGDAGEILRHGTPQWILWVFGLLTVATGLRMWHGTGPNFGIKAPGNLNLRATLATLALLLITVFLMAGSSW